jgi:tripartite-type tricarboxylate transporter receptor subunit TctC
MMRTMTRRFGFFLIFALSVFFFPFAQAQDYPAKPVTLVIPVGAGGSHDLTARAVTSVAADHLGQPIVIQLKPGGGGAIGSDFVSKAAPDGYTLLFGGPGWSSILPAVEGRSKGPDDLAAVCRINYSPTLFVARPDAPYKSFKEMITWAKANPGKLVFGNTGPWGAIDTPWKMVMKETGITAKVVPHDGGGPALVAILGGHVDVTGAFTANLLPHIKSGKLRPIVLLGEKRDPALPDVPTAKETGVNVVFLMWRGVLAPKATPRPVIDKLGAAFKKMTEDKSVISMIRQFGDQIQFLGPEEFTKEWRMEYDRYKEIGKIYKK